MRQERQGGSKRTEITLGDGSIVFELITPTQVFSNQQEEVLNGWSGGGGEDKMKEGENKVRKKNCVFVFSSEALTYTHLRQL